MHLALRCLVVNHALKYARKRYGKLNKQVRPNRKAQPSDRLPSRWPNGFRVVSPSDIDPMSDKPDSFIISSYGMPRRALNLLWRQKGASFENAFERRGVGRVGNLLPKHVFLITLEFLKCYAPLRRLRERYGWISADSASKAIRFGLIVFRATCSTPWNPVPTLRLLPWSPCWMPACLALWIVRSTGPTNIIQARRTCIEATNMATACPPPCSSMRRAVSSIWPFIWVTTTIRRLYKWPWYLRMSLGSVTIAWRARWA